MEYKDKHADLISLLGKLDEEGTLAEVDRLLETGDDPMEIVEKCQKGMLDVGASYEKGNYFVSGLIMAGEILRQVLDKLQPYLEKQTEGSVAGHVLLGTVQGDIHDLGKNIFMMLLRSYGFKVSDLGVDVAPEEFVSKYLELNPDIIAMSALLTTSYDSMRETIKLLRSSFSNDRPTPAIIVGGGYIDQKVSEFVDSDYWDSDAVNGIRQCQELVK